jgi:PAS domain S-box-containing protein
MPEASLEIFQSFCESLPFGVCLVDLEGKILHWNVAAESITGYSSYEVVGREYRRDLLVHGDSSSTAVESQCPLTEVLRENRPVAAELYLRHKLGHRLPIRVVAFPLHDAMGEMTGAAEVLDRSPRTVENTTWSGHSDREFELATGLSAIEDTQGRLQHLLRSPAASTSAVVMIEFADRASLLKYGGTGMLHQGIRILAKTLTNLLPPRNRVGCWSEWRLIAVIPDCTPDSLCEIQQNLAGIGSSCAIKWWGSRVEMAIRSSARIPDDSVDVKALVAQLEQDLETSSDRKDELCS